MKAEKKDYKTQKESESIQNKTCSGNRKVMKAELGAA